MKHVSFFILFFLIFFTKTVHSQDVVWLDANLQKTNQDKANFYKIGEKSDGEVVFYYKKRTTFRKLFYSKGKPNGVFYEYYETGELKETGAYENGLREGIWKEFYKGGKMKSKGKYTNGEKVGIWKVFYKNDK